MTGHGRGDTSTFESLVARVRGEYREMPGLRMTCAQACRLWQIDTSTCRMLLDELVREGFLCKTESGFYSARRPPADESNQHDRETRASAAPSPTTARSGKSRL